MTKKKTGLVGFAGKTTAPAPQPATPKRGRGSKDVVNLTLRLQANDWEKAHSFAVGERRSLQQLFVDGFNELLRIKGLPLLGE